MPNAIATSRASRRALAKPLAACLAALSFSAFAALRAQAPGAPIVRVGTVTVEATAARRQVTGNLRAMSRAQVAATEAGRVVEVLVRESAPVETGAVLARLDDRRARMDLAEAEAELASAVADVDIRRTEARAAGEDLEAYRAAEREVKGSVSAITLRAAERDARVAEARVTAAGRAVARLEARVERLRIVVDDLEIRAPFTGRVVSRDVEPGEWLAAGSPVCTLVSTGAIDAWLEVPEEFASAMQTRAADVRVTVDALGLTLPARELRAIPDFDPRTRRFTLIATLDPTDVKDPATELDPPREVGTAGATDDASRDVRTAAARIAPGMSVTATIPTGDRVELASIPSDALMRDGAGYFVHRVVDRPDGSTIAMPLTVQLAWLDGPRVWVEPRGLQSGDRVVVEGNERLRPMTPVVVDGRFPAAGGGR
ncbi:MAG: efflux RND transporter periplasmic adaptor subunit [Planctomycetes bacterium]|nr:efflux RND transporter periplasmic adaptor subunit [Planctomycetota bacterium]